GTTVAIAMAGQYIVGSPIFNGIASGTIAVVACAVAGSVTVLPAVLELLGPRIDRGRIPFLPHLHTDTSKSRFWPAVVDRVLRRPPLFLLVGTALLVALPLPRSYAATRAAPLRTRERRRATPPGLRRCRRTSRARPSRPPSPASFHPVGALRPSARSPHWRRAPLRAGSRIHRSPSTPVR